MTLMMKKESVAEHFDDIAPNYDYWKNKNAYYFTELSVKGSPLKILINLSGNKSMGILINFLTSAG